MTEEMKRDIDLKLAKDLTEKKTQLEINEDTEYNVFYDICVENDEKFLYLKLEEITSDAPFYYNRSYTIEELHKNNKIFKAFEKDDFEDLISYLKDLFDKGKIKLSFVDEKENEIKVELDVILFAKSYKLEFKLYREMIPDKKDEKMLELYELNKKNLKILKEIRNYAKDEKILEKLKEIYDNYEIPGIEGEVKNENEEEVKNENEEEVKNEIEIKEKNENEEEVKNEIEIKEKNENEIKEKNENEEVIEIIKVDDNENQKEGGIFDSEVNTTNKIKKNKICTNLKDKYHFNIDKKNFSIALVLKNNDDENWPSGKVKLICLEESTIKFKEVEYPMYDIDKGTDGDFKVIFDEKDLAPGAKYTCILQLVVDGEKIENSEIPLNIRVKKKKK